MMFLLIVRFLVANHPAGHDDINNVVIWDGDRQKPDSGPGAARVAPVHWRGGHVLPEFPVGKRRGSARMPRRRSLATCSAYSSGVQPSSRVSSRHGPGMVTV